MKGLRYLSHDTVNSHYPLILDRWLLKQFNEMAGERERITLKDIKAFLPQVNCQMAKLRLKEAFQEVDSRKLDELSSDDFASLYHILIHDDNVSSTHLLKLNLVWGVITFFFCFYLILLQLFQKDFIKYSSDGKTLTLQEFQAFIIEQKCDPHLQDSEALTDFMRDFVRDPLRNVDPPYFTAKEVILIRVFS